MDLDWDEKGKVHGHGHRRKKGRANDVEGQAYRDGNTAIEGKRYGQGHVQENRSEMDSVERFVEEVRTLAVQGKIPWEIYNVVVNVRKAQHARGATELVLGGGEGK